MFRRQRVVQNQVVAQRMHAFFRALKKKDRVDPETVARAYGRLMWDNTAKSLVDEKRLSKSRFYVGLATGGDTREFDQLTKRTTLITDTLLLSHDWSGEYHELGIASRTRTTPPPQVRQAIGGSYASVAGSIASTSAANRESLSLDNRTDMFGMRCPSLVALGQWLLAAEPLLKAGLAWYLPSYALSTHATVAGTRREPLRAPEQVTAIDYLIRDGRAIDASGAEPVKGSLVRPVVQMDLPFVEGVSLHDFSKITIEEFGSYSAFRDFLRQSFLELDESLGDVQSDRELVKLGLQIKDEVRSVRAAMERTRRTRAMAASGATIGSVGAILVAVYGPALASAVAAVGASGGVWGIIHAAMENSTRPLRESKWYYVWALARKANNRIL
ncbi:hypothetical protein [Streptomyces sp. AS02]|uniref:hypothetical protein n=1 Tax=Streptomyces sp. AS02 TaxID=2938946 RepID=UPI0020203BA9|nr:hypothetical protein [Streptomyces sp. AS02]MCL8015851.1 hypothetical protein [Streptomyces sp. AS02]